MRLKFLDEASFESRALRRKRGVAKRGERAGGIAHLGAFGSLYSLQLTCF